MGGTSKLKIKFINQLFLRELRESLREGLTLRVVFKAYIYIYISILYIVDRRSRLSHSGAKFPLRGGKTSSPPIHGAFNVSMARES